MAENFDLIFGSSASQSYSWNDSDYQNGWQTVGDTPPTREQFDALQRRNDTKAKELNSRLSPLEDKATADGRQTATAYAKGVMVTADGLPNGWLLECIVAGITGAGELVIPSPLVIGGTIVDGTVTWKILNLAMGGVPVGYVTPFLQSTAPDGWLSCAGAEVSRAAYPDLWNYVNGSSQLISETDWQSKNTAGDINIGWFSSGDGTTTFRLPRIVGSGELTEVKRFTTAGSGSFVAPVTGIYRITLQGAGGGGAGAGRYNGVPAATYSTSFSGGAGGEGGNFAVFVKLTAGTSYAYIIGAGGTGGAAGYNAASAGRGGDTSITVGADVYTAKGGAGAITSSLGDGGIGGSCYINSTQVAKGANGESGNQDQGTTAPFLNGGATNGGLYGYGGKGGEIFSTTVGAGSAGGDGYIEFAYNPVPQYWYVRAFGSATNQGTIDITALANMLNAKLSISDVPKIAGFSGKQTFTSSGTFTPTVTGNYKITLQGGGGGGSGSGSYDSSTHFSGAGGGQGGHGIVYEKLVAGTTYSFTIGAGGAGGTAGTSSTFGTVGSNGGDTSITINDSVYTATGGTRGNTSSGVWSRGGAGGHFKINDSIAPVPFGIAGGSGTAGSGTRMEGGCGGGGAAYYSNQSYNGGGGAGGQINGSFSAGGNGGDGYITFEWQTASLV